MGVIQQYERFVKPAHEDFVKPVRRPDTQTSLHSPQNTELKLLRFRFISCFVSDHAMGGPDHPQGHQERGRHQHHL
jgi:uridine kinase